MFWWFSRIKNKNGRSALNSIGADFGEIDAQQRDIITAVAAAASDPKWNNEKKICKFSIISSNECQRFNAKVFYFLILIYEKVFLVNLLESFIYSTY